MMAQLLLLLVLSLLTVPAFAQESPPAKKTQVKSEEQQKKPSLAELARQSRKKREASDGEVRVIRNEDLVSMRGGRVTTSRGPARKAASEEDADSEKSEGESEDEAAEAEGPDMEFWAQAFNEARTALQSAINRVLVLELRLNNLRNAYFRQEDGAASEMIQSQLAKTSDELLQAREDEDNARQILEQIERDALSAGLAPGDVRNLRGEIKESSSIVEMTPDRAAEMPQ